MQGNFVNGKLNNPFDTGRNYDSQSKQTNPSQEQSFSNIFQEFNKDLEIKRDERIRKEMEERTEQPTIEDEIIEAVKTMGQGVVKSFQELFKK